MKKIHIALAVTDIEMSVNDYAQRLGCRPDIVIPNEYALWRTTTLNLSIRTAQAGKGGTLRRLGWKDPASPTFSAERDVNGIFWNTSYPLSARDRGSDSSLSLRSVLPGPTRS